MPEIILQVICNANFYEYSIRNEELSNNTKSLHIDYDKVEGFIGAAFGKYYENIIEILTMKTIDELCELGYDKYRVVRLPDNIEIHKGSFNCQNASTTTGEIIGDGGSGQVST